MLGLAACATSAAGLRDSSVEQTFTSAKPPEQIANCAADRFRGGGQIMREGDRFVVTRRNGYGAVTTRWDFIPDGQGGTRVELRTSIPINAGTGDVRRCL